MSDQFCSECKCSGEPQDLGNGKVRQEENWECPLFKSKICETCCQVELAGGMGAPDTLRETVAKTGKTTAEILAICVACEHGGPDLMEPHKLIMTRGKDGIMKESGPEFEAADKEFREQWKARLERLKNPESLDAQLDTLYGWADGLMSSGRFADLDAAIAAYRPDEMPTDILLGVLTATLPAKSKLPARVQFYLDVERLVNARGENGPGLLDGLK